MLSRVGCDHWTRLSPPPHSEAIIVAFPQPHTLLVTFNRPKSLNAMTPQMTLDLERVLDWFEEEPGLWFVRVPVIGVLC